MNWFKDHFLIKEGYSLQDIEEMSTERYDYIFHYIWEKKSSGKESILSGGL